MRAEAKKRRYLAPMQFVVTATLALLLAIATPPSDPAAAVRRAESDFAAAFAAHDTAKFASMIEEQAIFFDRGQPLQGREAIVKLWTPWVEAEKSPFSWTPETAIISADGTIGSTSGPVYDAEGIKFSRFHSVWRKQKDGSWKVLFDGPGSPVCPPVAK
jgi:ketosteroid isomerase-like protein